MAKKKKDRKTVFRDEGGGGQEGEKRGIEGGKLSRRKTLPAPGFWDEVATCSKLSAEGRDGAEGTVRSGSRKKEREREEGEKETEVWDKETVPGSAKLWQFTLLGN